MFHSHSGLFCSKFIVILQFYFGRFLPGTLCVKIYNLLNLPLVLNWHRTLWYIHNIRTWRYCLALLRMSFLCQNWKCQQIPVDNKLIILWWSIFHFSDLRVEFSSSACLKLSTALGLLFSLSECNHHPNESIHNGLH